VLNRGRDVVAELRAAGVDNVSVSLNAEDETTYTEICKPSFPGAYEAVVDFVQKAKSSLKVEVTVVRMPEVNVAKAEPVAGSLGVKFRIREYIPCYF
jgi:TatD family-associated radical SAM protein